MTDHLEREGKDDRQRRGKWGSMPNDEGLFTQAEVDALMGKTRREVREKFSDYDNLKAKVAELEKTAAESDKLKRELESLHKEQEHRETLERVSKETSMLVELIAGGCDEEATS